MAQKMSKQWASLSEELGSAIDSTLAQCCGSTHPMSQVFDAKGTLRGRMCDARLAGAVLHALELVLCAFLNVLNDVRIDSGSGCHECDTVIHGDIRQACLGCELTIGCPLDGPNSGSWQHPPLNDGQQCCSVTTRHFHHKCIIRRGVNQ